MLDFGINILEPIFKPYFGCAFLINESEQDWPFNIFVFDCSVGNDWYGYLPDQSREQKFGNGHINLHSVFFVFIFRL
jgi:hypothetical protein